MRQITSLAAILAVLGLGACSTGQVVSRDAGNDRPAIGGFVAGQTAGDMELVPTDYDVAQINVTVPRSSRSSESNSFVPNSDIVWHGDPSGDRYVQIADLMT